MERWRNGRFINVIYVEIFFRRDIGIVYFSRWIIDNNSQNSDIVLWLYSGHRPARNLYIEFLRIFCTNCLDIIDTGCDQKFLYGIYANYLRDFRTNFYTNRSMLNVWRWLSILTEQQVCIYLRYSTNYYFHRSLYDLFKHVERSEIRTTCKPTILIDSAEFLEYLSYISVLLGYLPKHFSATINNDAPLHP